MDDKFDRFSALWARLPAGERWALFAMVILRYGKLIEKLTVVLSMIRK